MNALGKTHQSSGYNMTLGRLLEGLDVAAPHGLQVTDLVQDSRAATPGCVFLACPGRTTHGLVHVHITHGAAAPLRHPRSGKLERVLSKPRAGRHTG